MLKKLDRVWSDTDLVCPKQFELKQFDKLPVLRRSAIEVLGFKKSFHGSCDDTRFIWHDNGAKLATRTFHRSSHAYTRILTRHWTNHLVCWLRGFQLKRNPERTNRKVQKASNNSPEEWNLSVDPVVQYLEDQKTPRDLRAKNRIAWKPGVYQNYCVQDYE